MTVFDRINHNPMEDAGVWALTRDNVETLKAEMQVLREDTSITAEEKDYEAVVGIYGDFIGRTDENGELTHAFDEAGAYLMVAVKKGYIPGFAPVFVRGTPGQSIVPEVNRVPQEEGQMPEEEQVPQEEQVTEEEEGTED